MSMLRNPAIQAAFGAVLAGRSPRTSNFLLSTCETPMKVLAILNAAHRKDVLDASVEKAFTYANEALRASLPSSEGAERFRAIEGVGSSATRLIEQVLKSHLQRSTGIKRLEDLTEGFAL